jgi:hypothetical protein
MALRVNYPGTNYKGNITTTQDDRKVIS